MAKTKGIKSIMATMSTSEALMDDGFVVCCKDVNDKCETSVHDN